MKNRTLLPLCSFVTLLCLPYATAQEETKNAASETAATDEKPESELRTTGIAFSIEDETLLLTPENVKIPLTFIRTTQTPLVDESGKAVTWDQVRKGIPLTVFYTTLADRMIATKVVASRYMVEGSKEVAATDEDGKKRAELALMKHQKDTETAEKSSATAVTGGGTIMGFEQVISVGDGNGGDVVQYVVNNSTQYVTPGGKPVPPGLVRTGTRVEVKFIENGGRKLATQLVLHGVSSQSMASSGTGGGSAGNTASSSGTGAANSTTPNTASLVTSSGNGGGTQTAWVDQFGNIIPGTLESGFISPPLSVLPNGARAGANMSNTGNMAQGNQGTSNTVNNAGPGTANAGNGNAAPGNPAAGNNAQTGTANTTPNTTTQGQPVQPVNNQPGNAPNSNQNQPGTNQPNGNQPGNTQPATRQPGTTQPSTRQPSTRPATSAPSTGGAPSSPAPHRQPDGRHGTA